MNDVAMKDRKTLISDASYASHNLLTATLRHLDACQLELNALRERAKAASADRRRFLYPLDIPMTELDGAVRLAAAQVVVVRAREEADRLRPYVEVANTEWCEAVAALGGAA